MAPFQLLRYLKKWRYLIVAICLLGCAMVYLYCTRSQSYTAQAVIEYIHPNAAEGMNPDNTKIDPGEIISSGVITEVIKELQLDVNVEEIRSNFQISEIIPVEEQERKKSLLDSGKEYVYYPTIYRVSYTVSSSEEEARFVLDALLSQYFTYYCEQHAFSSSIPRSTRQLDIKNTEYVDCVEIIKSNLRDSVSHLSYYDVFYSARTGLSFKDLENCYIHIRDEELSRLEALVREHRLVRNRGLMLERTKNEIDQYEERLATLSVQIKSTRELIELFSVKTLNGEIKVRQTSDPNVQGDSRAYLDFVADGNDDSQTTYDRLMEHYAQLRTQEIELQMELERRREIYQLYQKAVDNEESRAAVQEADERLVQIVEHISQLDEISVRTVQEYNEKNGADSLSMRTNVVTSVKINAPLYMALAAVAFLILGCGLSAVLGRAEDIVDYFLYADQRTGLPNRVRCDTVIRSYEGKMLEENFSCMVFKAAMYRRDGAPFPRKEGDERLAALANVLRMAFEGSGFLGYNDNGMFIGFIENCSAGKVETLARRVEQYVREMKENEDIALRYNVGYAETSSDTCYEIRDLLRTAIGRCNSSTEIGED